MKERGYSYRYKQCHIKIKNLKDKHKKVNDIYLTQ